MSGFLLFMGGTLSAAYAQEEDKSTGKPNWNITPTVAVDMTYTDNVSPGNGAKKSDFITRLSPGIRAKGKSGRASGNLNFSWQHNEYADNSELNNQQRSLAADGKLELVEQWLFIDARGNIAQRPVSAFGTQGVGNELVNTNRTETTSYQWSPYIRGRLVGAADYELRFSSSHTSADAGVMATASGTTTEAWTGRFSGATPLALLGWSVNAESQRVEFGSMRETRSDKLLGTLEYRIDPQIRLFLNAGRESDNYLYGQMQQRTTSGYGLEWAPTERSLLSLKKDRHGYGDSYNASFSHRTALSAWKFSDSRSVSLPAQQMTQAPVSSAYDLLNLQLASSFPDPVERSEEAYRQLALLGIPVDALVYGNIMSSQPFTQRRQEASVALMGANNTVTLTLQRSSSSKLATAAGLTDDFTNSSNIRQTGINGNWAHKLSPDTALTLNALRSRSSGDTTNLSTQLRSLSLLLTTKLGVKTTGTVGLRQTNLDNNSGTSYDERALTGSLFVTF